MVFATLLALPATTNAIDKSSPRIRKVENPLITDIRLSPSLATADTCSVSPNSEIIYLIEGWLAGAELYKSYMDPSATCPNPYPFTVTEINLPMSFDAATQLVVSVDVELVDDTSYPGCPIPGVPIAISKDWSLNIPAGGGIFNIWIPLDSPVVVNGPFFAGFFISNTISATVNAALLADSTPAECTSFNIWDENIGWIDLVNNEYYNFPGNLAMEAAGVPGGNGGGGTVQPNPQAILLSPSTSALVLGETELWAADSSGSTIIDYISFSYSFNGLPHVEIGRDYDGSSPLRSGTASAVSGNGFSVIWNTSSLAEGSYTLRATSNDTLGRSSFSTAVITLDPTPPTPRITSPDNAEDFCSPLNILMNCNDENMSFIELYRKPAANTYHAGLTLMNQFSAGDNNGNPNDGNFVSNGEFGDFYSGPASAAMALKLWAGRGYTAVATQGATPMTMTALAEALAVSFATRAKRGTYDEKFYAGLGSYLFSKGNQLKVDYKRAPGYFDIRTWVEEEERAVIIGLSGNKGFWLAVDGFNGWKQPDGSYKVYIASPLTGAIEELPVRNSGSFSEIYFNSNWHRIDIMISVHAPNWSITRTFTKADLTGSDGWSVSYEPTGLTENGLYFFRASGKDLSNYRGTHTLLLRYTCVGAFAKGDLDNDGTADIGDLLLLMSYLTSGGAAPVGGALRADCNCDGIVNLSDAVYYMNYLFGSASAPCY